jgi:protein PhnA
MSVEKELQTRSNSTCELCAATDQLMVHPVAPHKSEVAAQCAYVCNTCNDQIENPDTMDANHWRCLNDSMWNENPAVQIIAWRMLHRLKSHGWPVDLLEMMYLDEDYLTWAKFTGDDISAEDKIIHRDSNGVILSGGDSIVVIKDLNVKGSSLVAKRGTAVRNISLVYDNPDQIEGKVEGQQIVLLTQFVKKT